MITFTTIKLLKHELNLKRNSHPDIRVGFVPTMGALHEGHMALIQQAKLDCEIVVCSIFVNPTQFNNQKDLETYPRDLERDKVLLTEECCDFLFAPLNTEIYPNGANKNYEIDFAGLDEVMEGKFRPGHFIGVAQVVERFLKIVEPDVAFFGRKDFQQVAIIKEMVRARNIDTQITVVPTKRNENGLALSSRNQLLSPNGLLKALGLSKALFKMRERFHLEPFESIVNLGKVEVENAGLELEYLEIVSDKTLREPQTKDEKITACIVAYCEGVRLIDNLPMNYELLPEAITI